MNKLAFSLQLIMNLLFMSRGGILGASHLFITLLKVFRNVFLASLWITKLFFSVSDVIYCFLLFTGIPCKKSNYLL